MPEVGAKCGLTIKLFNNSQFEFYRPEITIEKIDSSKPDNVVKADIDRAIKVSEWVFEAIENKMNILIEEQSKAVSAELKAISEKKF